MGQAFLAGALIGVVLGIALTVWFLVERESD